MFSAHLFPGEVMAAGRNFAGIDQLGTAEIAADEIFVGDIFGKTGRGDFVARFGQ